MRTSATSLPPTCFFTCGWCRGVITSRAIRRASASRPWPICSSTQGAGRSVETFDGLRHLVHSPHDGIGARSLVAPMDQTFPCSDDGGRLIGSRLQQSSSNASMELTPAFRGNLRGEHPSASSRRGAS